MSDDKPFPVFISYRRRSFVRDALSLLGIVWAVITFGCIATSMLGFAFGTEAGLMGAYWAFVSGTITVFAFGLWHICSMLEDYPQVRDAEKSDRIYIKPNMPDLRNVPRKKVP